MGQICFSFANTYLAVEELSSIFNLTAHLVDLLSDS